MTPGRILATLSVVCLALFCVQRARSPFLAAERERGTAAQLAAELGLDWAEVLALREGVGVELELPDDLALRARAYRAEITRQGNRELAIQALAGRSDEVVVRRFVSVAERLRQRGGR